jgi:hypothetical protein
MIVPATDEQTDLVQDMFRILRFSTEARHKARLMQVDVSNIFPEYHACKPQIKVVVLFPHLGDTVDVWLFHIGKPATASNMLDEI